MMGIYGGWSGKFIAMLLPLLGAPWWQRNITARQPLPSSDRLLLAPKSNSCDSRIALRTNHDGKSPFSPTFSRTTAPVELTGAFDDTELWSNIIPCKRKVKAFKNIFYLPTFLSFASGSEMFPKSRHIGIKRTEIYYSSSEIILVLLWSLKIHHIPTHL